MDPFEKYEYWKDIAEYDLETAEAMLVSGRYLYVAFMCQQAIEKLVKGLYVLNKSVEPPRTHNIWYIFDLIYGASEINNNFWKKANKYFPLFDELLAYYISERYPSYKEKLSTSINQDKASEILNKSKEVFIWLKSLKKSEE